MRLIDACSLRAALSITASALLNPLRLQLMPYVIVSAFCLIFTVKVLNAAQGANSPARGLTGDIGGQRFLKQPVSGPAVTDTPSFDLVQVFDTQSGRSNSSQVGDPMPRPAVPAFECADVIGKVFNDRNLSGYPDEGEVGLPGVILITARGLEARTDNNGRYHITCVLKPNPDRGSNFILKLDVRSLPFGYRLTTENPRVERATSGKLVKVNFGAAIHRRVRLDLADAVFEKESTRIQKRWFSRVDRVLETLLEEPSVLCLVYTAEFEELSLIKDRLQSIKREIEKRWTDLDCCYTLEIATKIVWRKGGSSD